MHVARSSEQRVVELYSLAPELLDQPRRDFRAVVWILHLADDLNDAEDHVPLVGTKMVSQDRHRGVT